MLKYGLTLLTLLLGWSLSLGGPFTPKIYSNYRTRCILMGYINGASGENAVTAALLQRIADQQAQMISNQQMFQMQMANQQRSQTDPQLIALLTELSSKQDRILDGLGKSNSADPELLRQLIAGQDRLLQAINNQRNTPTPSNPPIIVLPPSSPTSPPPVSTTPGGNLPTAGGSLNTLPGAGGPIQALPGPGGALNLIPPAGGSLQALPGPGGSITVLPGGVRPPEGTKPTIGVPPAGNPIPMVPGAGNPLLGPESANPVVFKTIYQRMTYPRR